MARPQLANPRTLPRRLRAAALGLFLAAFAPGLSCAQVSIERITSVGQTVPDRGSYVSSIVWSNAGIATISDVNVQLSLSAAAGTTMRLGQMYATVTHGVASESERVAVLLNRPGVNNTNAFGSNLGSLNVWFDDSVSAPNIYGITNASGTYAADGRIGVNPYGPRVAYNSNQITAGLSALNGDWQGSGTWSLLVADAQSGNRAQVDSWTLRLVGTAAASGTASPGAGGTISVIGTGTQTFGAVLVSDGAGSDAVNLSASAGANLWASNGLSGAGDFRKQGEGILRLGGVSSNFSGKVVVDSGEVQLASSGTLGSGRLDIAGANTLLRLVDSPVLANAIVLSGGNGVQLAGAGNLDGTISGEGGLTKVGADTLGIGGANTFSGAVRVLGGTLAVGSDAALGHAANAVTISNGAALRFTSSLSSARDVTVATGTTGSLEAAEGTFMTLSGTLSKNGSVLRFGGGGTFTVSGQITGPSPNSDLVVDGSTVVLSNTNSYVGPTIITNGGTLVLAADGAMPSGSDLILGGGTFRVGVLNYNADSALSMGTLTLTADSTIDLGNFGTSGDRNLVFANSAAITWATNAVLTISNWQGVALAQSDVTKLLFGTGGLDSDQLAQIRFADQNITGGVLLGLNGELSPIPEARIIWAALALSLFILWRERRRLLHFVRSVTPPRY